MYVKTVCVLCALITSALASGTVCGTAGMSGGSGTATSTADHVVSSTILFLLFSGDLSIVNSGSSPYNVVSSAVAPVIITFTGSGNTNCSGYSEGEVGIYRLDEGAFLPAFDQTLTSSSANWQLIGSDYVTPSTVYEVRVTAGGTILSSPCHASVSNVALSVTQPVCV